MAKTNLGSMSVEQLLQLRDDIGKELNRKSTELRSQLARLGGEIASSRGRGGSALKGKKVPPNIETGQATLGRVEVQNPDGWSPRLKKERSWKTLQLKRPLPRGSEEKNKLLVAPGGFPASWRWQSYCCYGSSYSFKQRVIAPVNIRQPKVSDSNICAMLYLHIYIAF